MGCLLSKDCREDNGQDEVDGGTQFTNEVAISLNNRDLDVYVKSSKIEIGNYTGKKFRWASVNVNNSDSFKLTYKYCNTYCWAVDTGKRQKVRLKKDSDVAEKDKIFRYGNDEKLGYKVVTHVQTGKNLKLVEQNRRRWLELCNPGEEREAVQVNID